MAKRHKQRKQARYLKATQSIRTQGATSADSQFGHVRSMIGGKYLIPLTSAVLLTSYSYALGIQDIQVNSNLGEPLSAMVYLSTVPGERISNDCFSVVNSTANSGLPSVKNATLNMTRSNGQLALQVSSTTAVKEPISEIAIATTCQSLPIIERTYTLMLDPAPIREARLANSVYQPVNNTRTDSSVSPRQTTRTRAVNYGGPIAQSSQYVVKVGDNLSTIAARIADRPIGSVWDLAAAIHSSNPQAFTNNNPNLIELCAVINIPAIDNAISNISPDKMAAIINSPQNNNSAISVSSATPANIIPGNSESTAVGHNTENLNNAATAVTSFTPAPQTQLPVMTASMRLSALSLERIQGRNSGLAIAQEYIPDTSKLFPGNKDTQAAVEVPLVAITPNQSGQNLTPEVEVPGSQSSGEKSSGLFGKFGLFALLASLLAFAFATWKFIIPNVRRRMRLDFIRSVREHARKQDYLEKNKARKERLRNSAIEDSIVTPEVESLSSNPVERMQDATLDTLNTEIEDNPFDLESSSLEINTSESGISPTLEIEDDYNLRDTSSRKSGGPRKSNVAEEIYEVGMIDDTGELVSLTTAFPELEAELNARLGDDVPDLGSDLEIDEFVDDIVGTRQTRTMETQSADFGDLQLDPDLIPSENAETMTVELKGNLAESLDLELPGLMDDETVALEADFETIAKDEDFSKTMVFNEEIFTDSEDPLNATTISSEKIDVDAETRVAPVLTDADGLSPSDFGLADEDFPVDRENYSYLEPDASIETRALNLTAEELAELGFDEDDNIIPFDPDKRKKSA
ncbi:MAG: hypothetical protein KJO88_10555 [Gammaproteobacteria bacterium]|nr:hypothetical protein [Gammaproteobacteria bacterium]